MSAAPGTFRLARPDEDELLARILYNAFLLNWDPNWWQNIRGPLRPVSASPSPSDADMTSLEKARMRFYRAVVSFSRSIGGVMCTAEAGESKTPAAALLWFPPHVEPGAWALIRSGFVRSVFGFGLVGFYHFLQFEHRLSGLFSKCLKPLGYSSRSDGAFVQIIATDPAHKGKSLASNLMKWQIERHKKDYPGVPVFLDTANQFASPVYERIGFRELGRHGYELDKRRVMEQLHDVEYFQAVMILEPGNM